MTKWVCFSCLGEVEKVTMRVHSISTGLPIEMQIFVCTKCGAHNYKEQLVPKWVSRWEKYNWGPAPLKPKVSNKPQKQNIGVGVDFFFHMNNRYSQILRR